MLRFLNRIIQAIQGKESELLNVLQMSRAEFPNTDPNYTNIRIAQKPNKTASLILVLTR